MLRVEPGQRLSVTLWDFSDGHDQQHQQMNVCRMRSVPVDDRHTDSQYNTVLSTIITIHQVGLRVTYYQVLYISAIH